MPENREVLPRLSSARDPRCRNTVNGSRCTLSEGHTAACAIALRWQDPSTDLENVNAAYVIERDENARLRAENEMLRLAFCDEAYIVAVQTLDVKALGKGRREILTRQAIRMLKVGLNEGLPRSSRHEDASLVRRAREKLGELEAGADA